MQRYPKGISRGIPKLHDALKRYHKRHWGVNIEANRFSITTGGVGAINVSPLFNENFKGSSQVTLINFKFYLQTMNFRVYKLMQ